MREPQYVHTLYSAAAMSGAGMRKAHSPAPKTDKKVQDSTCNPAAAGKGGSSKASKRGGDPAPQAPASMPARSSSPKGHAGAKAQEQPARSATGGKSKSKGPGPAPITAAGAGTSAGSSGELKSEEGRQSTGEASQESSKQKPHQHHTSGPSTADSSSEQCTARAVPAAGVAAVGAAAPSPLAQALRALGVVTSVSAPDGGSSAHEVMKRQPLAELVPGAGATGMKPLLFLAPPTPIHAPVPSKAGGTSARLTAQQNRAVPGTAAAPVRVTTAPAASHGATAGQVGTGGPVPVALGARGLLLQQVLHMTGNAALFTQAHASKVTGDHASPPNSSAVPSHTCISLQPGTGTGVGSEAGMQAEEAQHGVHDRTSDHPRPVLQAVPSSVSYSKESAGVSAGSAHAAAALSHAGLASAGSSTQETVGRMQAMRLQSAESPGPSVHSHSSQGQLSARGGGPATGRPPSLRPAPQPSSKSQGGAGGTRGTRGSVTPGALRADGTRGKGPLVPPRGRSATGIPSTATVATQTSPRSLVRAGGAHLPQLRAKVAAAVLYRIPIRADAAVPDVKVSPTKVLLVEDSFYEAGQEPRWLTHAPRPYGLGRQLPPYAHVKAGEAQGGDEGTGMDVEESELHTGPWTHKGTQRTVLSNGRGVVASVGPAGHSWPGAATSGAQAGRAARGRQQTGRGGRGPRIGWPVPSRRMPVRTAALGRARAYGDALTNSELGEGEGAGVPGGTSGYESTHSYGSASASQRQQRLDMTGDSSSGGSSAGGSSPRSAGSDEDGADSMDRLWGRRTRPRKAAEGIQQSYAVPDDSKAQQQQPISDPGQLQTLHHLLQSSQPLSGLLGGLTAADEGGEGQDLPVTIVPQPALALDAAPQTVSGRDLPPGLNYPIGTGSGAGVSPSSGLGRYQDVMRNRCNAFSLSCPSADAMSSSNMPASYTHTASAPLWGVLRGATLTPGPYHVSSPTSHSTAAKSLSDLTASLGLMQQQPSTTGRSNVPTSSHEDAGTGVGELGVELGTGDVEGLGHSAVHAMQVIPSLPLGPSADPSTEVGRPVPRAPGFGLRKALVNGRAANALRGPSSASTGRGGTLLSLGQGTAVSSKES